ncbi:MAG: GNAT family N-acetyltransferase [Frankiaceae bacterium]
MSTAPLLGATRPGRLTTALVHGRAELHRLAQEIEALAKACGTAATGRLPWLSAELAACPQGRPWAALARDGYGRLRGAVVLVDRPSGGPYGPPARLALLSGGGGHLGAIPVDGSGTAELLAGAVAGELAGRQGLGEVELGPLPAGDPFLAALAGALKGARLVEGDPVPIVRRRESASAADYLSRSMQRTLGKARNRLARDGVTATLDRLTGHRQIRALLPQMAGAYRERDHAHGIASLLDTPQGHERWCQRLRALVEGGGVEVETLHLDGALAAYVIVLDDETACRVLDGRFVGRWARYAPGRLLETAVLQRMLDDPRKDALDWMTPFAPEALLVANDAQPVVSLRAHLPVTARMPVPRLG